MMKRLFDFIAFLGGRCRRRFGADAADASPGAGSRLSENPTVKVAEMEVQRYDYVKRQDVGQPAAADFGVGQLHRSIVKSEMRGGISFGADNTFAVQGDLSLPLFAPSVYRTLKMNVRADGHGRGGRTRLAHRPDWPR